MIVKASDYSEQIKNLLSSVYDDKKYQWFFIDEFENIDNILKYLPNSYANVNDEGNVDFVFIIHKIQDGFFLDTIGFGVKTDVMAEFYKFIYFNKINENMNFYFKCYEKNKRVFRRHELFAKLMNIKKIPWKASKTRFGEESNSFIYKLSFEGYVKYMKMTHII